MGEIKTVIADDHRLFRLGLRSLLETMPDLNVIGEASNGFEMCSLLDKIHPDLVLMDLRMPVMDGVQATEHLRSKYPDIKIIILSMMDDESTISHLLEMGVNGYLPKNVEPEEMEHAIKEVMNQGFCYNEQISNLIRLKLINAPETNRSNQAIRVFSRRELQILNYVCQELTSTEIAEVLHLSFRTVEGHRKRIMEKLGAKNTAGMVFQALKFGIVKVG